MFNSRSFLGAHPPYCMLTGFAGYSGDRGGTVGRGGSVCGGRGGGLRLLEVVAGGGGVV